PGHSHLIYLWRRGVRLHIDSDDDGGIASAACQCVATRAGVRPATPAGPDHRNESETRWKRVGYVHGAAGDGRGVVVGNCDGVSRVLLPLREAASVRFGDAEGWLARGQDGSGIIDVRGSGSSAGNADRIILRRRCATGDV